MSDPIQAHRVDRPSEMPPPSAHSSAMPLFRNYPQMAGKLPHVALGHFPTPVQRLEWAGSEFGLDSLYIKRDDLSGDIYGGNKVRKLEFLLGDALRSKARAVITFGFAGSNHALATAIYARQVGLRSTSMLMPQANAHYVRRNLLASHHFSAELRLYGSLPALLLGTIPLLLRGRLRDGVFPRFIPAGGSSPLGVSGYVNAALELSDQIRAGEVPEPDVIYVPMGSMGTSAGLLLGLRAAGIQSRVIAVRVIEERMANAGKLLRLLLDTGVFLRNLDPDFPSVRITEADLEVRHDCIGDGYARFTDKGLRATELMSRKAGITLNGAYSAKAFSAILDDAGRGVLKGKTVLFWNTYNSRDLSATLAAADYHTLPTPFHRYFEGDVQPLDAAGIDR